MNKIRKSIETNIRTLDSNQGIFFSKFGDNIASNNQSVLDIVIFALPILYVFTVLVSFLFGMRFDNFVIPLVFIPLLVIYILFRNSQKKVHIEERSLNGECIIFYFIFYMQLILNDTIAFSNSPSRWFLLLIILLVFFYTDRFTEYITIISILYTLNLILLLSFKSRVHLANDLINLFISYPIVLLCALFVCQIRCAQALNNFALTTESSHDKLTGLLNKGAAQKAVAEYFAQKNPSESCAVLSIDADKFKNVNDLLGHKAGDVVLAGIGLALRDSFRVDDIIARNGGDEFLVVMKGINSANKLDATCRRIQKNISSIKVPGGWEFTCSIGIVVDNFGTGFDKLFSMADDALYECKIRGRNCFAEWKTYEALPDERPAIIVGVTDSHLGFMDRLDFLKKDYNLVRAKSGRAVLNMISQYGESVKVVILDLDIQKMTAENTLQYLSLRPNFKNVKIMAVSSGSEAASAQSSDTAILVVPMDSDEASLKDSISTLITVN
ncbi:MAG: GGDEF domain-containing protein [Butyrivibrio sp.]|nr:GGDEF domain-containing protein [Butyrivibrio sp.]